MKRRRNNHECRRAVVVVFGTETKTQVEAQKIIDKHRERKYHAIF